MKRYFRMTAILIMFVVISGINAQSRADNYEYFFQTIHVPDETTVQIALVSHESPHWDEYKVLDTGSDSICISIYENNLLCVSGHMVDQGSAGEDPSIGYPFYTVKVLNSGKSAYFYLEAEGQDFQSDIYFTYDWREDDFYTGGNCGTAGTTYLASGTTITTHIDDEAGNELFQPTNPSNLSISVYNNHPKLDWDASEHPSFTSKKYKVQRKPSGGSWVTRASNISSTTWTDTDVWTNIAKDRIRHYYRIQAYTTYPKYSPGYSNEASILGVILFKPGANLAEDALAIIKPDNLEMSTFPNPFNPITNIQYGLPQDSKIILSVYDLSGRRVNTLVSDSQAAGWYNIQWNGTSSEGDPVGTGVYLARIQAGDFTQVIKMVYIR